MNAIIRTHANSSTHANPFGPSLLDNVFGAGFNRLFDDACSARPAAEDNEEVAAANWVPAADVRQTDDAVFVDLEIPGVAKDDIDVSLEDGVLKVSGQRNFQRDVEKETYQRVERLYGQFSRSFRMPRHVDSAKVKASFKDGVLSLELPKAEEARPRQIAIH